MNRSNQWSDEENCKQAYNSRGETYYHLYKRKHLKNVAESAKECAGHFAKQTRQRWASKYRITRKGAAQRTKNTGATGEAVDL